MQTSSCFGCAGKRYPEIECQGNQADACSSVGDQEALGKENGIKRLRIGERCPPNANPMSLRLLITRLADKTCLSFDWHCNPLIGADQLGKIFYP